MHDARRVAAEIRTELRNILRAWGNLRTPLASFYTDSERPEGVPRHYVNFDLRPHRRITGLQIESQTVSLPDEQIINDVYEFSKGVWHLKDRLKLWVAAKGLGNTSRIENFAATKPELLLCADLTNRKKHGENRNRSGLDPDLGFPESGRATFDTSKSGAVELFYNGSTKEKELLVSNPNPLPFSVEVSIKGGTESFGDAVELISKGFRAWLPLIKSLTVLDNGDRESEALANRLDPL